MPTFSVTNLKEEVAYLKKEAYVAVDPNVNEFNCLFLNFKEVTLHLTF